MICQHFLPICTLSFHPLHGSFTEQTFFILTRSNFSIFLFISYSFSVRSINSLPSSSFQRFSPLFFSESLIDLHVLLCLIHFGLIWPDFEVRFSACGCPVTPAPSVENFSLLPLNCFCAVVKNHWIYLWNKSFLMGFLMRNTKVSTSMILFYNKKFLPFNSKCSIIRDIELFPSLTVLSDPTIHS